MKQKKFLYLLTKIYENIACLFSKEFWYFNRLVKEKVQDHCVMVIPKFLGDSLLILANLEKIEKHFGVKIFPIVKKSHSVIIELLQRKDPVYISDPELILKLFYVRFRYKGLFNRQIMKNLDPQIKIGNIVFTHPSYYFSMRQKKFIQAPLPEMFRQFFNMQYPLKFPETMAMIENQGVDINTFSKAVLLCPQAATVDNLPTKFWKDLSTYLHHCGWKIFYNSTKPVNFLPDATWLNCSLRDAVAFGQKAAFIISLRSGFCDLLANKGNRLIVIYPEHGEKSFQIFNLGRYFSRNDIAEYIFQSETETIESIKNHMNTEGHPED